MKKIRITTPENIEVEYTLAGLGSRTGAALIDMIIQGVMILLIAIALIVIGFLSPDFWSEYYGWIIGGTLLVYLLISYGYFIVMELSMNGMTLGKKIFKIRTIRNNGQPITFKHSALRNLFRVFLDVFGIGVVLIFFTKQHKRVGDYVASTIVVAEEYKARPVTIEGLRVINEQYSHLISQNEYEILGEYVRRRDSIENCDYLRIKLDKHFRKKFESKLCLKEWDAFITEF